jgi:hypothetical protein
MRAAEVGVFPIQRGWRSANRVARLLKERCPGLLVIDSFKALETLEEWYVAKLDISSRAHRHRALPAHTKAA